MNKKKMECKVAILVNGQQMHMPVSFEDFCHLEELGIEVEQVRWTEEVDENKNKCVKIEYPNNFFG